MGITRGVVLCKFCNYLLLLILLLLQPKNSSSQRCNANDSDALRSFSDRLDSAVPGWPPAGGGGGGDCCDWPGVICAPSPGGRVVGLDLANQTLRGEVSDSLAGLGELRVLDLSRNALRGALPAGILRLPRLEVLDVSTNRLAGEFPAGDLLPAARVFNVSFNSFAGAHPLLPTARGLAEFDVSGNEFSGRVNSSICAASPVLRVLRFSMNRLSGGLPAGLGRCRALTELSLDQNGLTGALPGDFSELTSLKSVNLHWNLLAGELPLSLRNLTALVHLDLSFNGFSGAIPDVFDGMKDLEEFCAPCNGFRSELPATLSRCTRLRVLNLRNNSLTGGIGLDFAALNRLVYLDLGINRFTGEIPASLPECTQLAALNLGRNSLAGEIPESFGRFAALSYVSLTGNNFSNVAAALRVLQRLPRLTSLVLTKNFRGGEAMPQGGVAGFRSLEVLVIANCELTGEIPPWLARLAKLKVLDVSWNRLTGAVPPWLGAFDRLFYLDISNNSLHGEIPSSLARLRGLTSSTPPQDAMEAPVQDFPFFIRRNSTGRGLQYNQVSSFPPSLILGHNRLVGGVPPAFGALAGVHVLDLSWNGLSGPIPPEMSGMSSLECLDLSHNNLTGGIPAALTKLSFLSHFDVAYNDLAGEIPTGGQFSTFSREDFAGNPRLCGARSKRCAVAAPQAPPDARPRGPGGAPGVAAAIGVGTALVLAVALLAAWRVRSKRRQEDNAKVAADDTDGGSSGATLVLLFPDKDDAGTQQPPAMTLDDLLEATGNFDESRIVGCGGFGLVYKAALPDGRTVAVKRLSGGFSQMEREFRAEVETLSRVRHKHLVPLHGYCRAGDARLLIYSYMQNGSLDYWLHECAEGAAALRWPTRLGIAQGAARGLAYLHQSCEPRVLHRDIKSSNILLDAAFGARLADFGLARLVRPHDTHVTTDLVGTLGYIPPEYGHSSVATYRGDVYSFGVVLLELVTGRRPVDVSRPAGRGRDVVSWALQMQGEARGAEVLDPSIRDERHQAEALRVLDVACRCVAANPKARPLSGQLVACLDGIVDD